MRFPFIACGLVNRVCRVGRRTGPIFGASKSIFFLNRANLPAFWTFIHIPVRKFMGFIFQLASSSDYFDLKKLSRNGVDQPLVADGNLNLFRNGCQFSMNFLIIFILMGPFLNKHLYYFQQKKLCFPWKKVWNLFSPVNKAVLILNLKGSILLKLHYVKILFLWEYCNTWAWFKGLDKIQKQWTFQKFLQKSKKKKKQWQKGRSL